MTFPVSPTNGQTTIVNNITYQYSSATNSWRRVLTFVTATINISGGAANQIVYQTNTGTTNFITTPTVATTYLQWTGSAFVWETISPTANIFTITNTTAASSTITGALQVVGGAGIGGNIHAGGTIFGALDRVSHRITVGTTAPVSPEVNDVWIDTN